MIRLFVWWYGRKAKKTALKQILLMSAMAEFMPPPVKIKSHWQIHLEHKIDALQTKIEKL